MDCSLYYVQYCSLICFVFELLKCFNIFKFQGGGGGGNAAEKQKAQEEQMRQQEEMKHSILSQVLDQQARARCKSKHVYHSYRKT